MIWVLVWVLLAAGLLGLALVAVPLIGRLRRNQAEVAGLRRTADDGVRRLRVTRAHISEWIRARRATGNLGGGA